MTDTFWALYLLVWAVTTVSSVLLKWDFHEMIAGPLGKKATIPILWKSYTKKEILYTLSMGTNLIELYAWYDLLVFFNKDEAL